MFPLVFDACNKANDDIPITGDYRPIVRYLSIAPSFEYSYYYNTPTNNVYFDNETLPLNCYSQHTINWQDSFDSLEISVPIISEITDSSYRSNSLSQTLFTTACYATPPISAYYEPLEKIDSISVHTILDWDSITPANTDVSHKFRLNGKQLNEADYSFINAPQYELPENLTIKSFEIPQFNKMQISVSLHLNDGSTVSDTSCSWEL